MEETNTQVEWGRHKELVGLVTSNKMDKTITVAVERVRKHSLYKKRVKLTRKYKAHDEKNQCQEGDFVRIRETRPLSKTKRWRFVEVIEHAK